MLDFSELYRRYAGDVFKFAFYLCGNRADAEDIAAETFVRVWSGGETRSLTVKGYLCTIARNLFLQRLRQQSRQVQLSDDLPDRSPSPEQHTEKRAELERVLDQLQQFPEMDRAALLMRALENLPYEEIGIALGISTTAAKVKVHRARVELERWRESSPESRK